jgi:hypothetical protein
MDLVTVLAHELGHVIGHDHSEDHNVMSATLGVGERLEVSGEELGISGQESGGRGQASAIADLWSTLGQFDDSDLASENRQSEIGNRKSFAAFRARDALFARWHDQADAISDDYTEHDETEETSRETEDGLDLCSLL